MEKLKQLSNLITRRDYSKIALPNNFEAPNLISLIKEAYDNFIYNDLSDLIKSFFPIAHEKNRKYELQFQNFKLLEPRFSEDEARRLGKTYESSIYVDINLVNLETGEVKQNKKGKKENISSGVYFGNIPLMTNHGTFVINGVEKFVMNQIVKSAGLYAFPNTQIKLLKKKKLINNICTEILPHRGTIMYFSVEKVGLDKAVFAYIRTLLGDNVAKLSVSVLLKAFGMSQNEILNVFSNDEIIKKSISLEAYNKEEVLNMPEVAEIYSSIEKSEGNEEKLLLGSPIDIKLKKLLLAYYKTSNKDLLEEIIIEVAAKFVVNEIKISTKMFESIYTSEKPICYQDIITRQFMDSRIYQLATAGRYKINHKARITERLFSNILAEDLVLTNGETLYKVGQIILNEELDNIKLALADGKLDLTKNVKFVKKTQLQSKISSTIEKIDIFGSSKMEKKITIISPTSDISHLALTMPDILSAVSYVLGLERKIGNYDDIEDLANKRIRLISEQLRNKLNLGMVKVEKFIKDKLASFSIVTANEEHQAKIDAKTTLHNVVNTGIFQLQIKNFFNTYDLTHFVDQVNPLSETTNKRRISSTGEGGVSVDDPNLSIRDIHSSHYGRICPTETPEGANVGLVLSMAMFAKLDEHGFLLSPFRKVLNGVATDEIEWMTPIRENEYVICEASVNMNEKGKITDEFVSGRYRQQIETFKSNEVDFMDIIPNQILSAAASCIPFGESNDGVRNAYGCNMQRQSLPLIKSSAPIVGTGSEYKIGKDSEMNILAKNDGVVTAVNSEHIIVSTSNGDEKYNLVKFRRSNQSTCINQTPIVSLQQKVKKGEIIADSSAMDNGELAIGKNVLIAFMHMNGYNYEDAVIISDRLKKDDTYTSLSLEEYSVSSMRNKLGDDEILRDVPNVSEESRRNLDEEGYVMIGSYVQGGDILVGKISPKPNPEVSPQDKLLETLFGTKSKNTKDTSLRLPYGCDGTVVSVTKLKATKEFQLNDGENELVKIVIAQKRKIEVGDKLANRHGNKGVISFVLPECDMPHLEDGTPIDICYSPEGIPGRMNLGQVLEAHLGISLREIAKQKFVAMANSNASVESYVQLFGIKKEKVTFLTKNIIAYKEAKNANIDVNDIDIILKNSGLITEDLSYKCLTPTFSGAKLDDIYETQKEAGLNPEENQGKFTLIDGRTGEVFDEKIAVGVMYVMKLDHMVADKIHARAIGPYSKITQQPLGGRAQNGGQRFGEMEVWALEGYGAAYNLREMLTIKSDDVRGRNMTYSSIIQNKSLPTPAIPESFKILTKYLQGIGIGMELEFEDESVVEANELFSSYRSEDETEKVQGGLVI